mmetsp:Transcript_6066/g.17748  ORF Transcript_6066/g.17748 Transcript_6066/m.17748 type:complete len:208 (-) Transcript_6066:1901-2524(-)
MRNTSSLSVSDVRASYLGRGRGRGRLHRAVGPNVVGPARGTSPPSHPRRVPPDGVDVGGPGTAGGEGRRRSEGGGRRGERGHRRREEEEGEFGDGRERRRVAPSSPRRRPPGARPRPVRGRCGGGERIVVGISPALAAGVPVHPSPLLIVRFHPPSVGRRGPDAPAGRVRGRGGKGAGGQGRAEGRLRRCADGVGEKEEKEEERGEG